MEAGESKRPVWKLAAAGVLAVGVVAGAAFVGGCGAGKGAAGPPRLVLLYATCSLQRDFLSPYDSTVPWTPNLERFARRATVFTRHHTEAGQSGIAYASLFTGTQADRHGVFRHPRRISEGVKTIFEVYAARGYETYYWNAHIMASALLGYARGVPEGRVNRRPLVGGDGDFRKILDHLRRDPSGKALVVTNFTLTHRPYSREKLGEFLREYPELRGGLSDVELAGYHDMYLAHSTEFMRSYRAVVSELKLTESEERDLNRVVELAYASNVWTVDRAFGSVLDAIEDAGLLDEALIVFTSDHGETHTHGQEHRWSHGFELAPEVIQVPLLVAGGGLQGGDYSEVTRSIDVLPTLLGLTDGSSTDAAGVDLSSALLGKNPAPKLRAWFHTSLWTDATPDRRKDSPVLFFPRPDDPEAMWVGTRIEDSYFKWRNLDGKRWGLQVFDMTVPPAERRDLFDAADPQHLQVKDELLLYKARLVAAYRELPMRSRDNPYPGPDEELEALRSLGYVQ